MITSSYFIEIAHKSIQKAGQEVCGDVFLNKKIYDEGRTIAVLSDGLGSGIKANVLATITASMALNFTIENQLLERSAQAIKDTLPVDQDRKISYATFTIVDIEYDNQANIVEYGNPQYLVFRETKPLKEIVKDQYKSKISKSSFKVQKEDRIILFSDGVSQSGIGRADMPFGWEIEEIELFTSNILEQNPKISAEELVNKITNKAHSNDSLSAQDDISCIVIYFRLPRNLLICTGPPYKKEQDKLMADTIRLFDGNKIVCGGTTAQIVSRELGLEVETDLYSGDTQLPPISYMKGIDLVTEGILTIGKVAECLETNEKLSDSNPAEKIIHYLLTNDHIKFLVGTKINDAHQDPTLPVELEIRRNVIKKIAYILKEKYLKEVEIQFI